MDANMLLSYNQEKIVVWINSTSQEDSLMVEDEHKNFTSRTIWSTVFLLNLAIYS